MENNIYLTRSGNYYTKQMEGRGIRGFWFKKRHAITEKLVRKYIREKPVLDLGCGNCLWNNTNIPTVGVDISEPMLRYNKERIAAFLPLKGDINEKLPFRNDSIQTVVVTELLEHIPAYRGLIDEIERILVKGGIVIVSVPFSKFPGLWGLVFPLWCKYKWWKDRDEYYLKRCGHVANFSIKDIMKEFDKFIFQESVTMGLLTLFAVFRKN